MTCKVTENRNKIAEPEVQTNRKKMKEEKKISILTVQLLSCSISY